MAQQKEYYRLPGGRLFALGRRSLYRGADHILYLSYRGFTEEYRRFYFADIQAIFFRKTSTGRILNGVYSVFAALFALWALWGWRVERWETWGVVTVAFFAGIFGGLLMANLILGSTCKCYLQTAVQLQHLPSLRRTNWARKAIRLLQPEIEAAQGALTPDQLSAIAQSQPGSFSLTNQRPAPPEIVLTHDEGRAHQVLFVTLILQGLFHLIRLQYQSVSVVMATSASSLAVLGLMILCLVRQKNTDLPQVLKKTVYWTLAFVVIKVSVTSIYDVNFVFGPQLRRFLEHPQAFSAILFQKPADSPLLLALLLFVAVVSLVLGAIGLLLVRKMQKQRAAAVVVEGGAIAGE